MFHSRLHPPWALALLLAAGCAGSRGSAPAAPAVLPRTAILAAGQSLVFTAAIPPGLVPLWSVDPPASGTITAAGAFTASGEPGVCTVILRWGPGEPAGSATVTVLQTPGPALATPSQEQASGRWQVQPGTNLLNAALVGEVVPVTAATSPDPAVAVRHGFLPPGR